MFDEPLAVDPVENQFPNEAIPAANWLQTTPSQMPWSVPLASQPTIMRFTGDTGLPSSLGYTNPAFDMDKNPQLKIYPSKCMSSLKRKLNDFADMEQRRKQLITEEKMAANLTNLNGLHISNDYVAHQCGTIDASKIPGNTSAQQNTQENHMPTLVLCEELRRLTAETVIPPAVMAKLDLFNSERPTNAVVLWKPPAGSLGARMQQIVDAYKGTSNSQGSSKTPFWNSFNNNNNNNNNSSAEDMNDPESNKERQDCRNAVQDDSSMEI